MSNKKLCDRHFLIGKWFHSFDGDGNLGWQGEVLSVANNESFIVVQLYEWIVGQPTVMKIVNLSETKGWIFHETNQDMKNWHSERY